MLLAATALPFIVAQETQIGSTCNYYRLMFAQYKLEYAIVPVTVLHIGTITGYANCRTMRHYKRMWYCRLMCTSDYGTGG